MSRTRYGSPTLERERELWSQGCIGVAGVDDVGCGALAGPSWAAAVILSPHVSGAWLSEVRDSKLITTERKRERLAAAIRSDALAYAVGIVELDEVEQLGEETAKLLAMDRAVSGLPQLPEYLLIDGESVLAQAIPQTAVVHGDEVCMSIACASILAKVAGDRHMHEMAWRFPGYGFEKHKGYASPEHDEALLRLGLSPAHRRGKSLKRLKKLTHS